MTAVAIQGASAATMTSREIAELTGKEHKNVLADIRKMLSELEKTPAEFSADLPDSYGRPQQGFRLPKRETLILVSGYNIAMRARIIDRWQELEAGAAPAGGALNLRDPRQMLAVATQLIEINTELETKVAVLAPKAAAFDLLADADGSLCVTDAAKTLQIAPHRLTELLEARGWAYRRPACKDLVACANRLADGCMEHRLVTGPKPNGGTWSRTQARITPRGLAKLAEVVLQVELH